MLSFNRFHHRIESCWGRFFKGTLRVAVLMGLIGLSPVWAMWQAMSGVVESGLPFVFR